MMTASTGVSPIVAGSRLLAVSPDQRLVLSEGPSGQRRDGAVSHVHILAVADISGRAWLVFGWVIDSGEVACRVLFDGQEQSLSAFAIGGADGRVGYRFAALLPHAPGALGLHLTVQSASGETVSAVVGPSADMKTVEAFLLDGEFEAVLAIVGRLVEQHNAIFGVDHTMSSKLDELLEVLHKRIADQPRDDAPLGLPTAAYLDVAQRVGTKGIVLKGWIAHTAQDRLQSVTLRSFFGRSANVAVPLPASTRLDVVEALHSTVPGCKLDCGFVAFGPCADIHAEDKRWFAEIRTASGSLMRVPFPLAVQTSPRRLAEEVAMWAEDTVIDPVTMYDAALGPALGELWRLALEQKPSPVERTYGATPDHPSVSVVVPLYGRIDFLKHQIANFAGDADFRRGTGKVELIYVLDDPRKSRELEAMAVAVAETYDVPFKVLDLRGNFGYSTANNSGAAAARAKYLLLLNSDVIPKKAGWVSELLDLAKSHPESGAVGCRLLYEDGSIQHAGMEFRPAQSVQPGSWLNHHTNKGLAVSFDPHPEPAEVPAVTGACLLTPLEFYRSLGGLSDHYVIGDFEDSDYCLKVRAAGRTVLYTPRVELFHLERQSMRMVGDGRHKVTLFNMWQHSQRWGREIEGIVAAQRKAVGA